MQSECKLEELDLFKLKGMDTKHEESEQGKRAKAVADTEDHMQLLPLYAQRANNLS